jgi:hypothetical protein
MLDLETDPLIKIAKTTGIDIASITRWFSPNASSSRQMPSSRTCEKIGKFYHLTGSEVMRIIEIRRTTDDAS